MTQISYQLYSSREFPPLADTLKMLKDAGYGAVEGYGGLYGDPAGLKAELDRVGLAMPSGHFSLEMLEREPDRAISIARTLGMRAVYCPHLAADDRPAGAAGWRAFGKRLEEAGAPFRAAGLDFGWHNHDFEFRATSDGAIPMEEILHGGPGLSWEADIAWIVRGGADPLEWVGRFGSRITAAHVKDIAPEGECVDEDGWADVGHGVMDWRGIWEALRATPAALMVMEHDKPNDDRRFATRSIASVNAF